MAIPILSFDEMQAIFDQSPDVYLVLLPDAPKFTMVAANDARLVGTMTTREAILGHGVFEVFPDNPDDVSATGVANLRASLNRVLATKAPDTMPIQRYDIRRPASEGGAFEERYWAPANHPILSETGEVRFILHRVEDVTELVRTRRDREKQKAEKEAEIRRQAEFEKYLIGIVSHDLKGPISAIIMGCQTMLHRDNLPDEQTRSALRVLHSGERAARMIADILDFTQARLAGGIPIHRRKVNLREVVLQMVEEVQATHPDRSVEVNHQGEAVGEWDADRLQQLLTNLVRNALTYGAEGTPIRVTTHAESTSVTISVHNQGQPIPAEKIPQLFEPMQRATEVGASSRSVGLGLFIVNAIARAHGGTISVESSLEQGTTFTVRLPRSAT